MRFVGYLLKTLALTVAATGLAVGPPMWEDTLPADRSAAAVVLGAFGAVALALAVAGYAVGNRAARRDRPKPGPASLSFTPGTGETWLDPTAWACLPDPAPAAARPAVWVDPAPPEVAVPPDEILRRLWLARAHMGTYKATSVASARVGGMWAVGLLLGVAGLLLAYGVDTRLNAVDAGERAEGLGGILAGAVLLVPVVRFLQVVVVDTRATFRRHALLHREIAALEAADDRRPGGALDTSRVGRYATPETALVAGLRPDLDRALATFPPPAGAVPLITIDGWRGRG